MRGNGSQNKGHHTVLLIQLSTLLGPAAPEEERNGWSVQRLAIFSGTGWDLAQAYGGKRKQDMKDDSHIPAHPLPSALRLMHTV
jgi:hypothetical protein